MPTQPVPADLTTNTLPRPDERTTDMRLNGAPAPDAEPTRPRRWSAFGAGVAILVLALIATAWYAAARGPVHRLTVRSSSTGTVLISRAVGPLLPRAL